MGNVHQGDTSQVPLHQLTAHRSEVSHGGGGGRKRHQVHGSRGGDSQMVNSSDHKHSLTQTPPQKTISVGGLLNGGAPPSCLKNNPKSL